MSENLEVIIRLAQAEALREAADEFHNRYPNGQAYNGYTVARMLNARADRIEKGGNVG